MTLRNEKGFSLVELMVTMVVFVLVIAASSQVFTALLTQFKQQSKIGESNIEGIVGLDILRRDLAGAGFGLPQDMNSTTYSEAVDESFLKGSLLNDATGNPPAAFRILNNNGISDSTGTNPVPGSVADVLAIKSSNVAFDDGAQKWSYISNRGSWTTIKSWGAGSTENLISTDRVIVLYPDSQQKLNVLQKDSTGKFYSQWGTNGASLPTSMQPQTNSYLNYVAYGVGSSNDPVMPFNRADYYVKRPASLPSRCAPNTGVLYKGVVNNLATGSAAGQHTELPVLDCVADFQVDFLFDKTTPPDGYADWPPDDGTLLQGYTAADVRARLKEVRVYIVAQEGQKDINYDFSQDGTGTARTAVSTIENLDTYDSGGSVVHNSRPLNFVDLKNLVGDPEYKYYRWKLYTIVVQPNNLR